MSLFPETEQEFERVSGKVSLTYEMIMTVHPQKSACPFCKNYFRSVDRIISCDKCHAIHHVDCWNDNSGCGIFGCEGKKVARLQGINQK